jgi:phage-related tail fiber protein
VPVVVIIPKGQVLRGTSTATLSGGSFLVTDGVLTCTGNYNSMDTSPTITMQTLCSDGRKGFIVSTREASGSSGHGQVHLNDGTSGEFVFGHAAENF